MHASIWRFTGDPDDLLRRYDAMLGQTPAANMRQLHDFPVHVAFVDGVTLQ